MSTGKNVVRPISYNRFCRSSSNDLRRLNPNLRFHCLNRIFVSRSPNEAIRSVSHLGLARSGSMPGLNNILSNRKERTGPLLPGSLRLGFVGQPFYYHARSFWQARVHQPCAHPATGGTRKLSVPGRVHSVSKSCGSSEAWPLPESNPLLTRGTVESPAKCLQAAPF